MIAAKRSLISLFTGIGGLDIGLEYAGFLPVACVEIDTTARTVLQRLRPHWPLYSEGDVCKVDPKTLLKESGLAVGELDLLAAGPPCQPFSHASAWRQAPSRVDDPRVEPFRVLFREIGAQLRPKVMLIENVPALGNDSGRRWIRAWFRRLNEAAKTSYVPHFLTLNAADHGVPQSRRRLFIVAERNGRAFETPKQSHYAPSILPLGANRHVTAWDAIGHFENDSDPALNCSGRWADLLPTIPEGHNYYHHTSNGGGLPIFGYRTRYWSFLLKLARDRPSWTLSALPGPATGPFHWENRRLSEREMAALQTIPLHQSMGIALHSARKLLGNAVPAALGELIGHQILVQLLCDRIDWRPRLVPQFRDDCPDPLPAAPVPKRFLRRVNNPDAHPGAGLGPRPWKR